MAKETAIIFVYDTKLLQKEEDDPATAILYFHPAWVSDQQKTALCGQVMGTIECLKSIFSIPKMVSLQSGKFFIIENGRYILAVGTDRNIMDWFLEHRAKTLYSLFNFFHKDFQALAEIYQSGSLSAKLYHIFETYLKMLFFGGNIFSHVPSLSLPKSASNVFTEAINILQCCQEFNNVLGGSILYHNKVVATHLTSDLTKMLVLSDPYRIKCPAEIAEINFDLPLGVQLLQVYITNKEYQSLFETSVRNRSIFQYLSNKSIKKPNLKTTPIPDTPMVSAMKRDQSLLFTAVPEEGSDHSPLSQPAFVPAQKKPRPKFLNLKSLSIESSESKPVKNAPITPFCGQTSVASTPMTELKRFVHQNPLSIISDSKNDQNIQEVNSKVTSNQDRFSKTVQEYIADVSHIRKCSSLTELRSISDQYYNKLDLDSPSKQKTVTKTFKTITDPTFPVFKSDGTTISQHYYDFYVKFTTLQLKKDALSSVIPAKLDPFKDFDYFDLKPKETDEQVPIKITPKPSKNSREHRKSLTLPLKPLTADSTDQGIKRRYSSGVQLTPLMSKLSILAFEERSSGFGSRETTPSSDFRGLTPTQPNFGMCYSKYKSKEVKHVNEGDEEALQKCVLFVCGQQDVVLALVLREECCSDEETVKKLWELCTEHLVKLEKQLNICIESQPSGTSHESEPYSYLCLDDDWDTLKRGGPWGTNDLGTLMTLHRDFKEISNLTEILLRGSDNIVYGHHCGPTEIFYHESAGTNAGLPPPADPMGLVQLKARRRLERDHTIILL